MCTARGRGWLSPVCHQSFSSSGAKHCKYLFLLLFKFSHLLGFGESAKSLRSTGVYFRLVSGTGCFSPQEVPMGAKLPVSPSWVLPPFLFLHLCFLHLPSL